MHKILLIAIAALTVSGAQAEDVQVRNLAGAFAATWDATQQLPMAERIAAFKQQVASQYPEFYAASRFETEEKQDARIARAIENFGPIRQAYLDKVNNFGAAMPVHVATFRKAFPDFELRMPTSLVHSLGEMDGGTRRLGDGKVHLIFGADVMTLVHRDSDEAAFFHHELFHTHHDNVGHCESDAVWNALWREGLATYVSYALNPKANKQELLLDFPKGMVEATQAQLPKAWKHLQQVLDSTDRPTYSELFMLNGPKADLPRRRGYYLGYLVASDAAKTHDMQSMARLGCAEAHALVEATVKKLSTEGNP